MKVNLSYREAAELQGILKNSIGEIKSEIRHSQMHETKAELKRIKEDLINILKQLEEPETKKAA